MNDAFEHDIDKKECSAVGCQTVDVCIPVTVKPFGSVGNVKTHCEGKPVITHGCGHCPGTPNGVCEFTISQRLQVEVPVIFGARAEVGDAHVNCGYKKQEEAQANVQTEE
ncbi:MAG TPA: hypothetical protein IAA05_15250 [Candidatus Blautia excrementipullorum]|nr:hypothetical protein [Candidatus Blautia excrementipullorum]